MKTQYAIALEQKLLAIMFECSELVGYWYSQFLKKPYDPADDVVNKLENYYFPLNNPDYYPPDFVVQNGVYFATDTTGYGVLMFFEITRGFISNMVVCDYGNPVVGTQLIYDKNDLGGLTGTEGTLVFNIASNNLLNA